MSWTHFDPAGRPNGFMLWSDTHLQARKLKLRAAIALALLPADQIAVLVYPTVKRQVDKQRRRVHYVTGCRLLWGRT